MAASPLSIHEGADPVRRSGFGREQPMARVRRALAALALPAVLALSACGGGGSASVADVPPTISAQPAAQSITSAGVAATFSVTATGAGGAVLGYQWQISKDAGVTWADIANALAASYSIATPDAAMNGQQFRVLIRAGTASTTSAAVTLAVAQPAIAVQPVDIAITDGGSATLSVTATGMALHYQWQSRTGAAAAWADIAGATAATYVLTGATTVLNGTQYRVLVSSGTVAAPASAVVTLSVAAAQAPTIGVQPVASTTASGSNATFSVSVAGTGITYQWQVSLDAGLTWADLLAAISSSYTVAAPTIDMNGYLYRALVASGGFTVTTDPARLSVSSTHLAGAPYDVSLDADGKLIVVALPNASTSGANQWTGYVQKVDPATGAVFTLAGSATQGYLNGVGAAARFNGLENATGDGHGNVFVSDLGNAVIRKVAADGTVTTFAGNGSVASTDGPRLAASFVGPRGLAFDASGNLYVADQFGFKIRKIAPDGTVSTLAGGSVSGTADGLGAAARFSGPTALIVGPAGVLYVADGSGIRTVTPAGQVNTLTNSPAIGLATDAAGNVYSVAWNDSRVYKTTPAGVTSVFAGGAGGFADGVGAAARFQFPFALTIDAAGNLYVADTGNHALRKITPAGVVSTVVGP